MKKNLFMTAAAIAALLTGCSTDEEIANIETSAKNAIGFNIVSNGAETKATIHNNGSTNFDFDVFAFNSTTGALFMGNQSNEYSHDGVDIIYNKENKEWDYKNLADLAYWPTNRLDFYAVSPATFDSNLSTNLTWLIHSDEQKISYSTIDEFNNKENSKNLDVMYAVAKNQAKGTNSGIVKLNFKHTLSQVLFRALVQDKSMEVTIKEMKVHNFVHGGTFTIPEGEPAQSNWSGTTPWVGAYTVKKAGTDITVSTTDEKEPIWISSVTDPMLFIPQQLTAWSTTPENAVPKDTGNDNGQSYLEIEMKLTQNRQYLIGSEGEYKKIYVPFTNVDTNNVTGWEPGKRYIYTLKFGGGYDDQGKPILTPIKFNAEVTNWSDASGYNIQVK